MSKIDEKHPIVEGLDAPNCLLFGRGYGETASPFGVDATTRYNSFVTRTDPYTGRTNPVLARVAGFEANNAGKYRPDPNPELDEFVDTLFLDDMGPEGSFINGENTYKVIESIPSREVASAPQMPAPKKVDDVNEKEAIDDGFLDFASMFGSARN